MFSASYAEARAKFLSALDEAGGTRVAAIENPAKGPAGEALFTDVGRLGPDDASRLLVLVSGTHGLEGFCGSGCHTGWLARGLGESLPADTAVLFVHAINPHGFAWARRVNEDNVDLNRNFLDHSRPHPVNADYAALQAHIDPPKWTADVLAAGDQAISAYYGNPNADFLPKAVHGGQYVNPRGTFFGGVKATWSNTTFREIIQKFVAAAEQICVIDYHTGGGVYGFCDLYVDDRQAGTRARDWFEHCTAMEDVPTEHGHNQADVPGLLMYATAGMLPKKRVTSCLVEMRTAKNRGLLRALREENWLFQHGDPHSPRGRELRAELLERAYPSAPEWRSMVLRQSNAMIGEALSGLARA
jgi:hypothetical protein